MLALAVLVGMVSSYAGLLLSYHRNLPSGPAIVMAAGVLYGVSLLLTAGLRWLRTTIWRHNDTGEE
jgi:zinc/manganese transport system permease protein